MFLFSMCLENIVHSMEKILQRNIQEYQNIHKGVFSYEFILMLESFASNGFHTFILRYRYPTPYSNKSKSVEIKLLFPKEINSTLINVSI